MMTREELEAKIEIALQDSGIYITIQGCGCCGSPVATLYNADGSEAISVNDASFFHNVNIDSRPNRPPQARSE
jgi:hypothetical protein